MKQNKYDVVITKTIVLKKTIQVDAMDVVNAEIEASVILDQDKIKWDSASDETKFEGKRVFEEGE